MVNLSLIVRNLNFKMMVTRNYAPQIDMLQNCNFLAKLDLGRALSNLLDFFLVGRDWALPMSYRGREGGRGGVSVALGGRASQYPHGGRAKDCHN